MAHSLMELEITLKKKAYDLADRGHSEAEILKGIGDALYELSRPSPLRRMRNGRPAQASSINRRDRKRIVHRIKRALRRRHRKLAAARKGANAGS